MPIRLAGILLPARAMWSNRCDCPLPTLRRNRNRPLPISILFQVPKSGSPDFGRGWGGRGRSALPGFETALGLVDDENPALAPHYTIIAVAPPQRFQGVTNFHRT